MILQAVLQRTRHGIGRCVPAERCCSHGHFLRFKVSIESPVLNPEASLNESPLFTV